MKCLFCSVRYKEGVGGVSYHGKPICVECLMQLFFIAIDKGMRDIRKHIKQEIKLEHYNS